MAVFGRGISSRRLPSPLVSTDESTLGIRVLIEQTRAAGEVGLFLVALVSSLAIIDACGGASAASGWSNRESFETWVRRNLPSTVGEPEQIYRFRNALLHQGRNVDPLKGDRIGFLSVGRSTGGLMGGGRLKVGDDQIQVATIERFVEDVCGGASRWVDAEGHLPHVQANLASMVSLHPDGVRPFVGGVPMIF